MQIADRGLGLTYAHGLDEDHRVPGCFAEESGRCRLGADTAENAGTGRGTNERVGVSRQRRHPRAVTQNRAAGALRRRIDRQDGDPLASTR